MVELLIENPLLLLFIVAAIGYPLGRIKLGGSSLGVAAVLFVGLAFGGLDPNLKLPEVISQLGLVLFVYTIGLSSGPGFLASFRGKGLRDTIFVAALLLLGAGLVAGAHALLGLRPSLAAGLFAGSLTNTPALAGVIELVKHGAVGPPSEQLLADPVVAYSIAYPVSVLGIILLIVLFQRLWRIDYAEEARRLRHTGALGQQLESRTIKVLNQAATGQSLQALIRDQGWDVIFGRRMRVGELSLLRPEEQLALGDLVTAVGSIEMLDRVTAALGAPSAEQIGLDRRAMDYRRIVVSNPRLVGQRLRTLNLPQHLGAIITRVRRGDIELLPHGDTELQLGDRVRVVTRRDNMDAVTRFFGDSYRALSEIDILSFSLGIALGILLGLLPLPLPGGVTLRLGLAGGPLVVALVLGAWSRTGPIVWSLPYSANLMLRQIGLVCFLAGVGTRSGYAFVSALWDGSGLLLLGTSLLIVLLVGALTLWVGYRLLKIPMSLLLGLLAGLQTQPATLGFALEATENELPNTAYAMVFPVSVILKIVLAQLLLLLL